DSTLTQQALVPLGSHPRRALRKPSWLLTHRSGSPAAMSRAAEPLRRAPARRLHHARASTPRLPDRSRRASTPRLPDHSRRASTPRLPDRSPPGFDAGRLGGVPPSGGEDAPGRGGADAELAEAILRCPTDGGDVEPVALEIE